MSGTPGSEAYALLAEICERSEATPGAEEAALLVAGASRFPRNLVLTFRSARICAIAGFSAEANRLVAQGLRFATGKTREPFEKLRTVLTGPASASAGQSRSAKER